MPLHIIAFPKNVCFVPICFVSRMRSKCLLLLCIRLLLLPSAARCSSLPWSKRPNDQSLGLGLKKMRLVVTWLVAKISGIATQRIPHWCQIVCGVRVEWRLGRDACGIEEADWCWPLDGTARVGLDLLLYATTSVIPYVSSGARGAGCFLCGLLCRVMPMVRWPLWFVMPCYAMVKCIVL